MHIRQAVVNHLTLTENSDVGVEIEFNNVQEWAGDNTMILNLIKTKELIFHNPKARTCHSNLPVLLNIERVTSAKLLGIYIQSNFSCDIHFNHIMTVSSQRLHILKVLKRQGLSLEMLHNVFYAIIVSKITYAISCLLYTSPSPRDRQKSRMPSSA